MGRRAGLAAVVWGSAALGGCLPGSFDALGELAPVTTTAVRFPGRADARVVAAWTVPADDEGRGRVLLSDGEGALGWYRIDERRPELRFATHVELAELANPQASPDSPGSQESPPTISGVTVVETLAVAEGLVRFAAPGDAPDRVVRFRISDFSRPSPVELDMLVYPWVEASTVTLEGPLAAVQLDEGLAEALSGTSAGLMIWDSLGARASEYAGIRELLATEDPDLFALIEQDPPQGWGLTWCPGLRPTALAGGRVLPGSGRSAAIALDGANLTFVGLAEGSTPSLIGAPIYSCELATLALPGPATTLAVVDLDHDGDDDLLVGAPASDAVWIYENTGSGLPATPTRELSDPSPGEAASEWGTALALVELGGDAPEVIAVGAPGARVDGRAGVGRVELFDAADGTWLRTLEDLVPRTGSRHGLGVHGLDLPGREELVVTGAGELRAHWSALDGDPRP